MKEELESSLAEEGLIEGRLLEANPKFGDYAINIQGSDDPHALSELARRAFVKWGEATQKGPFVNLRLDDQVVYEHASRFATTDRRPDTGETVVVEFSSPNIAKEFSVSHLRSTLIGNAIANINHYQGNSTHRINHLGDWGTQFGKLLAVYHAEGGAVETLDDLQHLYQGFHERAQQDTSWKDRARAEFARLESGDRENVRLWSRFRNTSLEEFEKLYDMLGVEFDEISGESKAVDHTSRVVWELEQSELLEDSEGARIVDLSPVGIDTPALLLKSDGSTLYLLRDVAAAIDRHERLGFDRMIYEVGSEQTLHFQQVFGVLNRMGYDWADDLIHADHGLYIFDGAKMSSRTGNVVRAKDLIDVTTQAVLQKMQQSSTVVHDPEETARSLAVSAIVFNDLKTDRSKPVKFNPEQIVEFHGDTGPYLNYTQSRIQSILDATSVEPESGDYWRDLGPYERQVARSVLSLQDSIPRALHDHKPHHVARGCLTVAKAFNSFYARVPVIGSDEEGARLALLQDVRASLNKGLDLLGIPKVDKM